MRADFPSLRRGDRIEPSLLKYPDAWHLESVDTHPVERRKFLVFRRPKISIMYVFRLFCVSGIQEGVPGLRLEHVQVDTMRVCELGMLHDYHGATISALTDAGFFWVGSRR
eukprot:7235446-Pyramimonas_sp.AAC.1